MSSSLKTEINISWPTMI